MDKKESTYCNCLYYSSNALARIMTRIADESFQNVGISSSYAFLIMTVNKKPGIQPKEISQELNLTQSTVTRLIEKMEYKSLLERKQVGRTTEVFPTKESVKLNDKIKEAWSNVYEKYMGAIGEKKGKELTDRISEAIEILS